MTVSAPSTELARRVRVHAVTMTSRSGASHVASCLSVADILAVLYSGVLRFDPRDPKWAGRDRFVMSKGHAAAALYATLAEVGFFPPSELSTFYGDSSRLLGHVSHYVPGVEVSTGSLGHGLGIAAGMALSGKLDRSSARVVALLSDGECDEGSVWEAALFARHHSLGNLTALIDYNKFQSLGSTEDTLRLEPFVDKWRGFGWETQEVNGHDHDDLRRAMNCNLEREGPRCIVLHTTKGKGVSFMENSVLWHYRSAQGDELVNALRELGQ